MLKILTVIGARPQFIKAAPVSEALRARGHQEFLVHTGQHYDYAMSKIFFEETGLAEPDVNLEVGSGSHAWQTAQMLIGLEQVMAQQRPDYVLVYGDTNSTLAGALAAAKLRRPIVHIEAGLRSFNREMPEEINRLLTDHCADILFCPTQTAVNNLAREGITTGVSLVGDTMLDATLKFAEVARQRSSILDKLKLEPKNFLLATLHRPYNTDEPAKMREILKAFSEVDETVVFLVHPRTRQRIDEFGNEVGMLNNGLVQIMPPLGYLDTLMLEQHARMILTDSGGMQKEAYFFGVPCVTLRPETEWIETVESGWNVIAGSDAARIVTAVKERKWPDTIPPAVFGDGSAAQHIVTRLAHTAASSAGD